MQNIDLMIVGGGTVGTALACKLAQASSLSIAILEAHAHQPTWSAPTYHHRVSAIALSSQRIFQDLQIWDTLKQSRVSPFTKIQVWDAATHGKIQFDSQAIAQPCLGYIIENNLLQSVLMAKAQQYSSVKLISPVNLDKFCLHADSVELTATDGERYRAKLVIAADGAASWLRNQAGIPLQRHDYEQHAIVARVQTALPHQQIARQVFLPAGPLAFLPLQDEYTSSIVWSLPSAQAQELLHMPEDQFKQALTNAFDANLGQVVAIAERFAFPLSKQQAANYVQPRVALVGDAAHTIHPLAGQGVNMGLLDAISLADVILTAHSSGRDFASHATLRRYERRRRAENLALLSGVDILKKLFASERKTVQALRSLGLNATNQLTWLKNIFTRHAVG